MQAFSNIRVIDLTHVIAGPFCTYQLAVMGADVIKIEPPNNLDMSRDSGELPLRQKNTRHENAKNNDAQRSDFTAQNANKRAICIDLKTAEGADILRRLICTADVLVENYRSGALAKLGFDYAAVKKIKADIIYCSISGFGGGGPIAERTAYDNVIQAYSGLMAATGDSKSAPLKVGPPVLDYGTGIQAAFAIAAALFQRERDGFGQCIDVAMLDAAIMLMSSHVTRLQNAGEVMPVSGNNSTVNAGYCCYATKDGLLMLGAYTGAQVAKMWAVLGDAKYGECKANLTPMEMADDFDFDSKKIAAILMTKTAAQWEVEFNQKRVPAARVRELDETLTDPQLAVRRVLQTANRAGKTSGDGNAHKLPTAAFQFADHACGPQLHSPPPESGAHTAEVLREMGYGADEMMRMETEGVIKMAKMTNVAKMAG